MTRESAFFQLLLLKCGITEQFDIWFDELLKTEDPISEETLGLIGKGNDINALISYLEYVSRGNRDEYEICRRIRSYLREEYLAGRLTNARCAEIMYIISVYNNCFDNPVWYDMYCLSDVYDCAADGFYWTIENFEEMLLQYLETGDLPKS